MKYGSVCSGIEAASVAWHHLGWEAQWFSEIEHFPSEVLKYRFPTVENLGDMTKLTSNETFKASTIDLLVGGTPCQSFSVAGLRRGLADPRGNLMLTFLSLANAKKPRWIVWENVVGVLSSNGGKDFGTFLGALGELGYGFAYRVLDAQYFGVAQRRRRVFVVGYLGDWRVAAAVLFERESLQGNIKPSRKKREEVTTDAEGSVGEAGDAQPIAFKEPCPTLTAKMQGSSGWAPYNETDHLVGQPIAVDVYNQSIDGQTSATITEAVGGTNTSGPKVMQPIAVDTYNQTVNERTSQTIGSAASDSNHIGAVLQPIAVDVYNQKTTGDKFGVVREQHGTNMNAVLHSMAIRRLTPKECERLQGFPDDWTKIPYRNKPADQCPDGPRYKACGNSMAVPVMRWIGERIQLIDTIIN